MPLDAVKPSKINKRFRSIFYGGPGLGKTLTSISFPRPYVIDTEAGCENDQYVRILEKGKGVVLKTLDYNQIISNLSSLRTENHPYKTLIIDSITYLYQRLVIEAENNPAVKKGWGGPYIYARNKIKEIISAILKLDMNAILICHEKIKYSTGGYISCIVGEKEEKNSDGTTSITTVWGTKKNPIPEGEVESINADGPKDICHMLDLVLHVRSTGIGVKSNASIIKSRFDNFKEGSVINFNFKEIAELYGKDSFEKDSVPVNLASKEQIDKLQFLIDKTETNSSTVHRWLKKADATCFSEMESEKIQKCIDHLQSQIKDDFIDEDDDELAIDSSQKEENDNLSHITDHEEFRHKVEIRNDRSLKENGGANNNA